MPSHDIPDIPAVRDALADLTAAAGWSAFQTPRNMALALTGRVGAVAAHLQFAGDADGAPAGPDLAGEIADCLVYLVALADALGVDLADEAVRKLRAGLAEVQARQGTA